MLNNNDNSSNNGDKKNNTMDNNGRKVRKKLLIYFTQSLLIYLVVIACIVNLSIGLDNQALWASLLSGSLGYMLPSPGSYIKRGKRGRNVDIIKLPELPDNDSLLHTSTEQ